MRHNQHHFTTTKYIYSALKMTSIKPHVKHPNFKQIICISVYDN